ncbi:hypothetical protein D3C85_1673700 [compost metagenome]
MNTPFRKNSAAVSVSVVAASIVTPFLSLVKIVPSVSSFAISPAKQQSRISVISGIMDLLICSMIQSIETPELSFEVLRPQIKPPSSVTFPCPEK